MHLINKYWLLITIPLHVKSNSDANRNRFYYLWGQYFSYISPTPLKLIAAAMLKHLRQPKLI